MTETEKYVKTAQSRVVTSDYETATNPYEPEFKPFSYGTELQEDTAFEVEKQYTFDTNGYSNEESNTVRMDFPTLERKEEAYKQPEIVAYKRPEIVAQREIVARPKLNAHGKVMVSVFSIIVAIIVAFCIYNAVSINSLENAIAAKSQIVATQNEVISQLENEYNSLGEDDSILSRLGDDYKQATDEDIVKLEKFEMSVRSTSSNTDNWFNRFCEKLRKLFS